MLPGQNTDEWTTTLRSGLWRLPWQLSAEGRRRYYAELVPVLHDTKLEVMGSRDLDCYYLVYLGTKPSGRGRGYARKLIEQMAARVCLIAHPAHPYKKKGGGRQKKEGERKKRKKKSSQRLTRDALTHAN